MRQKVSTPYRSGGQRTGRPRHVIVKNPKWVRKIGLIGAGCARRPPFGPVSEVRHGVTDIDLVESIVIAHRGGLVSERAAMGLLTRIGRFQKWLETYKPVHGPRPDPERALWLYAAVQLAKAAIKRQGLAYREPSPAGLVGIWDVMTGSETCPKKLYRRYQNLAETIRKFERGARSR